MQMQVLLLKRSEVDHSNDAKYVWISSTSKVSVKMNSKGYIAGEFKQGGVESDLLAYAKS